MTGMNHWVRELREFDRHLGGSKDRDYRSWQPTKWQSLESVRDRLLALVWDGAPTMGASALELGCGSATLLIQLISQGVAGVGVDHDPGAREIARRAAVSVGVDGLELVGADFFRSEQAATLPISDLVFHVGVIEHFDEQAQLDLLQLSARLSHRWVMIGIPHEHGPVFRSFIKAVTRQNAIYDDDHRDIDVPALVARAGYRVVYQDGAHLFYSTPTYYIAGDPQLDELYARLREELVAFGGDRFADFPHQSFDVSDIDVLRKVEDAQTPAERYRVGFLRYYIIDTLTSLDVAE